MSLYRYLNPLRPPPVCYYLRSSISPILIALSTLFSITLDLLHPQLIHLLSIPLSARLIQHYSLSSLSLHDIYSS
jgi:hypothetical protein